MRGVSSTTARLARALTVLGFSLAMAACSTVDLGGVGAETKFNCQAPQGVACQSVSGLYANATAGTLPSQNTNPPGQTAPATSAPTTSAPAPRTPPSQVGAGTASVAQTSAQPASPALMAAPFSGHPLRSAPKVLRIWVAPVEDAEGDLHDQRFMYVTVNNGRWMIEANRLNIQRQYRPVIRLGQTSADGGEDGEEAQASPATSNPRASARRAAESAASRQGSAPAPSTDPQD